MMASLEKEDWNELVQLLREAEKSISENGGSLSDGLKSSQQALKSFHSTAAMLGYDRLETAGLELERYLTREIEPAGNAEAVTVFGFAVNTLIDEMNVAAEGDGAASVQVNEALELLGIESPPELAGALTEDEIPSGSVPGSPEPEEAPAAEGEGCAALKRDFEQLQRIADQFGGKLAVEPGPPGNGPGTFTLSFTASSEMAEKIHTLLSAGDPGSAFAPKINRTDDRTEKILVTIKDFMLALSESDIPRAQEILLKLAEQQRVGLYNEIGGLARELHNSLKGFMSTMDPALKEMVEERIPDSGNRLEHILKLTETSANTTLDAVETMQKRNTQEQNTLDHLLESASRLTAIGEPAFKRIEDLQTRLKDLQASCQKTHDDLIVVTAAQDYQDLTGQIVMKIMQLLNDLEQKLVNVIRTFGAKVDAARKSQEEKELYGPAHEQREEALHSQDDVDSLLAEFGF